MTQHICLFVTNTVLINSPRPRCRYRVTLPLHAAEASEQNHRQISTNLRCHKVCRVARRHEQAIVGAQLLRKAKVTDVKALWSAVGVSVKQVRRFQVTMNHLVSK